LLPIIVFLDSKAEARSGDFCDLKRSGNNARGVTRP
jgi:hypothetical protein